MKKIIISLLFVQLLLFGCSEKNKTIDEPNQIELTLQGVNNLKQLVLKIGDTSYLVEDNEKILVSNAEPVVVELVDEEKTWNISLPILSEDTTIDVSNYLFDLNNIKELISQYSIEHTRAMALKDMTQWTSVTTNFIENSELDYINEALYEGQVKEITLHLDTFTMTATNLLNVQATLALEERYYLTEEVESLHAGHSHGEDHETHSDEITLKEYTINFQLKKEGQWKVDRIDFQKQTDLGENTLNFQIDAPFFTPTTEAIDLAQYYLDYQQISIFLEEFFTEYTKALNFKNEEYIKDYTTKESIFYQQIQEQSDFSLVELVNLTISSIEKKEKNQYKCQVEITFVEKNEEKKQLYDFYVMKKEDHTFIILK